MGLGGTTRCEGRKPSRDLASARAQRGSGRCLPKWAVEEPGWAEWKMSPAVPPTLEATTTVHPGSGTTGVPAAALDALSVENLTRLDRVR